jgi:hypothetical protein
MDSSFSNRHFKVCCSPTPLSFVTFAAEVAHRSTPPSTVPLADVQCGNVNGDWDSSISSECITELKASGVDLSKSPCASNIGAIIGPLVITAESGAAPRNVLLSKLTQVTGGIYIENMSVAILAPLAPSQTYIYGWSGNNEGASKILAHLHANELTPALCCALLQARTRGLR